ncbi:glycine/D-amino acid oxidase-like deaminating enzyme [Cryobacterium mesophilum]|uniref:FAD-binding oxidoreductase n=1 Tax=Terrimesophilobacter mesophilus TaxID=433647 RepID=A0A4R8VBH6_9MICO|nr:FAD-binding oxidoreductase [Terrimesophilobacter mesophilus]MBB5632966.1 glycine/D-amino acid oxidase-like deaminating enzyme [Terrimesophilobacter mesophilus]TFB79736.1 FAD-binding oxidoreductase [Terrimesophilobacter mesophilus]
MRQRAVVIGAGIVGSAAARSLAKAGLDVVVVDRSAPASGTTAHGEGNLLVSDKAPGPELVMALAAAAAWPGLVRELEDELGEEFPPLEFEAKGGLVVATTEQGAGPLLAFASRQRAAGVDAREITVEDALRLEPDLNPAITAAVHYPQDSQVQPVAVSEALLASARRHGATVMATTGIVGPILGGSGELVGVRTDRGELRADAVVVAAGPWSGEVARTLGVSVPVRPRRGMVLVTSRMPRRIFHKVYDADYVGAVGSDDASLQTSSVVEATESGNVLIGSSRQQLGFDDRLRVDTISAIATKALRLFPFLSEQPVIRTYGGFRPYMPDHLPLVGPDHRLAGLWHATGHEGAGIGLAPVTGDLLAAMITGTEPLFDPAPYAPSRPSLAPYLEAVA